METRTFRVYIAVVILSSIVLGTTNDTVAAEESVFDEQESSQMDSANTPSAYALAPEKNSSKTPPIEYVKGQLIVKLKEGYTLADIQELSGKYYVNSAEKVFNEMPPAEDTLTQLKQKLGALNAKHDSWYWQLEKDSAEYKDYMNRIEQEKNELNEKIATQEKITADKKQESASSDINASNLENVFVQIVPEETDILLMAADYRRNPAVEYAEPNYVEEGMILKN